MANRNFPSQKLFSGHVMPVMLDCSFTVAATDAGGLGITGLTGPFVQNVFMHTTQTPGAGNRAPQSPGLAVTNPNPAAGIIVVQLQDNYSGLLAADFNVATPLGTSVSVNGANLTIGNPYVITDISSLPVASAADWVALGLPSGITPAVGVAFIAAATGSGTSASRVAPPATAGSGILDIEQVGSANAGAMAPNPGSSQGFGAEMIFRCMSASGGAPIQATPADGSVITMKFLLSNSSVRIQGE